GYGNDSGYEGPLWDLITNKKELYSSSLNLRYRAA
ncbi:hypothetical protein SAMN04488156_1631, partial [Bacillus sp. 166amftsu]